MKNFHFQIHPVFVLHMIKLYFFSLQGQRLIEKTHSSRDRDYEQSPKKIMSESSMPKSSISIKDDGSRCKDTDNSRKDRPSKRRSPSTSRRKDNKSYSSSERSSSRKSPKKPKSSPRRSKTSSRSLEKSHFAPRPPSSTTKLQEVELHQSFREHRSNKRSREGSSKHIELQTKRRCESSVKHHDAVNFEKIATAFQPSIHSGNAFVPTKLNNDISNYIGKDDSKHDFVAKSIPVFPAQIIQTNPDPNWLSHKQKVIDHCDFIGKDIATCFSSTPSSLHSFEKMSGNSQATTQTKSSACRKDPRIRVDSVTKENFMVKRLVNYLFN